MTFHLDPTLLQDLLEPHVGARVTITQTTGGGVLLSDPLPARLTIASRAPGLFVVGAAWSLDTTPVSVALVAANVVNLGGDALGNVTVDRDEDGLSLYISVQVHGPVDPGRDFAAAIGRTLATAKAYFGAVEAGTARAIALAQLDGALATAASPNTPAVAAGVSVEADPETSQVATPPPFTGYL